MAAARWLRTGRADASRKAFLFEGEPDRVVGGGRKIPEPILHGESDQVEGNVARLED